MAFRENLKSELIYKDMLVKELAAKTGISRHTLDNYLNVREHLPTVDVAVKIAQALDVSVEYLVTGKDTTEIAVPINKEAEHLIKNYFLLNKDDQDIVSNLVQLLIKHRRKKLAFENRDLTVQK